jgi:uncharacterized protein YdeI (YjbR/CyaY-like superfamily)
MSASSNPNPKVDWYFAKVSKWQDSTRKLREISLGCSLEEELKWGKPTYKTESGMIFLIHTFKDYAAILFFKGVLMPDPDSILVQQTANVQSARQIRFTSSEQISSMEKIIVKYIQNAIEVEKSGLQVEFKKTTEFSMAEEFQSALAEDSELADAFYKLTPGRQRGYLLYFGGAKQSKTRIERVEKSIPYILKGKGISKSGGFEE